MSPDHKALRVSYELTNETYEVDYLATREENFETNPVPSVVSTGFAWSKVFWRHSVFLAFIVKSSTPKCNDHIIILKELTCGSHFYTIKPINIQQLTIRQRTSIEEEIQCYDGCVLEFQYLSNTKITTQCHKDIEVSNNTIHQFIPDKPKITPRRILNPPEPPSLNTTTELYLTTSPSPTTVQEPESTVGNTIGLTNFTNPHNIDDTVVTTVKLLPVQYSNTLSNTTEVFKNEERDITTSSPVTEESSKRSPVLGNTGTINAIKKDNNDNTESDAVKYISRNNDFININITYTEPVNSPLNDANVVLGTVLLVCRHENEYPNGPQNILATITNYTSRTDSNVSTQFGDIIINSIIKEIRLQNCNFDFITYTLLNCNIVEFVTKLNESGDAMIKDYIDTLKSLKTVSNSSNVYFSIFGIFEDGRKKLNLTCIPLSNSSEESLSDIYDSNLTESTPVVKTNEDLDSTVITIKTERTQELKDTIAGNASLESDQKTAKYHSRRLHDVEIFLMATSITITSAILAYLALKKWKQRHHIPYCARDAINRS